MNVSVVEELEWKGMRSQEQIVGAQQFKVVRKVVAPCFPIKTPKALKFVEKRQFPQRFDSGSRGLRNPNIKLLTAAFPLYPVGKG